MNINQKNLFKLPLEAPNVAKVPQYSPFRYPGGKSWFYPFAKGWMQSFNHKKLIEPFAGGAHVGLAAAIEDWVQEVILVEKDENVAAVWKTILSGDCEWLVDKIINVNLNRDNLEDIFDKRNEGEKYRAFAMLVHNRVSRGGITSPGAGIMNKGENNKGIKSRWYPDTLVERINRIRQVENKIKIIHDDGFKLINKNLNNPDCFIFIDPPYPKAGRRLYEYSDVDHENIFSVSKKLKGKPLITYDNSDEIQELVRKYGFESEEILMSTTHHEDKYELIIGKNLNWLET